MYVSVSASVRSLPMFLPENEEVGLKKSRVCLYGTARISTLQTVNRFLKNLE
jgi:hypothetical protein